MESESDGWRGGEERDVGEERKRRKRRLLIICRLVFIESGDKKSGHRQGVGLSVQHVAGQNGGRQVDREDPESWPCG
jgi:hypothetical protein